MNKWIQCREFIARQGKKSEMRTGGEGGIKKVIFKICRAKLILGRFGPKKI